MKKSSALFMVILLLALGLLSACGGAKDSKNPGTSNDPAANSTANSLDRVKKAGVLKVAIDAAYPPMEFVAEDGKSYVGFDIDYAKALADKLGVKAQFENVAWDGILTGLEAERYDVIISSMTITDERQAEFDFVQYFTMGQSFVVRPDSADVKVEKDLAGKTVAVQNETTSHFLVDEWKKEKVKGITEVRSFPFVTDAFLELKSKRADAIVCDEPVAWYYAKQEGTQFKITGKAAEADPIGIAIRKNDTDLKAAITKAVADLKADGTYKKISEKWFGGELGQ